MKVLVTGPSGFIGPTVCAELRRRGHSVRAAVRANASNDEVAIGDIQQVRDWSPFLESVDAVVHLVARVNQMRTQDDDLAAYRRINVDATAHLAAGAVSAGVAHFVFLSSVKAMGEATEPGRPFRETDPPRPLDPYAESKLEAERELARICGGTGTSLTMLRPPLVYGPGVKGNFLSLLRAVDRGLPLPFGSIPNARSLVSVHNLASAIVHVLGSEGTFLVSDGEDVSTPELVRSIGRALGKPARLIPVPLPVLRALGIVTGRRAAMDRLVGSLAVDTRLIRESTGWRPPESLADGLARTAEWYRSQ